MRLVAQAEAHRGRVSRTEVVAGLIQLVRHGRLELTVDEGVEVLADRPVVVRAHDQIGAAGARLETRVERGARVGAAVEIDRASIVAGRKLHPELQPEVVRRQQSLVGADQLDVAELRKPGATDLVGRRLGACIRSALLPVSGVRAHHVRDQHGEVPVRIRGVIHAQGEITVDRLLLDLTAPEGGIGRSVHDLGGVGRAGPGPQPVLVDEVVFEIEAQPGQG